MRPREPVGRGLRRLAKRQLKSASEKLRGTAPSDESIHEARTRVKKVRSIVHLIEEDGGHIGRSDKRLRSVSRALSRLRDADAMIEILAKLKREKPHLFSEHTYARIRRLLVSNKAAASRDASRDGDWPAVVRKLRRVRTDSKKWRPKHARFGALAAGMRVTLRAGRKAIARARKRKAAADFHELRKNMKSLRYELRLVQASSAAIRKDVTTLHRAEEWLGDDHNLVVLCAHLSHDSSVCGGPVDLGRMRCAVDGFQRKLRRKALTSVRRIYAVRPRQYVARIRRAWKAWRHHAAEAPSTRRRTARAALR